MLGKKIKTVGAIMAPLIKTRNKLMEARDARHEQVTKNLVSIQSIEEANQLHLAEASLAVTIIKGLDAQLAPLEL